MLDDMSTNTVEQLTELTDHDVIESYLSGLAEAVAFAESQIVPILNAQLKLSDKEMAILGTYIRFYLCSKGILALNDRRFFQLVASTARTGFELLIDICSLAKDPSDKAVKMFTTFAEVERFRSAAQLTEFLTEHPNYPKVPFFDGNHVMTFASDPNRRKDIEQRVQQVWGTTKKGNLNWPKNHWSGIDLRKRASDLGEYYETLYLQMYPFTSWYSHSGSVGYACIDPEGFGRIFGSSANLLRVMFVEATEIVVAQFELEKVINNFHQVIDFLKVAPEEYLKKALMNRGCDKKEQTI
jgi:hypothetical protein